MHILTYATDVQHEGFKNFVESAKEFTRDTGGCCNLGYAKPWYGWLDKFRAVRRYLSCVHADEDVLFVDGYDSVFVRSTQDIANMLVHKIPTNAQVVVGAEINCFPQSDRAEKYANAPDKKYKYLNSGCYYGSAGYLRYMFDDMGIHRLPTDYNDQQLMTDWFLNHQHTGDIVLDYDANIFMNLYNCESDLTFEDGRAYNKVTRSFPCIIHGNGKSDMTPTLNFLAERRKSKKEQVDK